MEGIGTARKVGIADHPKIHLGALHRSIVKALQVIGHPGISQPVVEHIRMNADSAGYGRYRDSLPVREARRHLIRIQVDKRHRQSGRHIHGMILVNVQQSNAVRARKESVPVRADITS